MNLGDKVKFRKELRKGINLKTDETLEFVKLTKVSYIGYKLTCFLVHT